MKQITYGYSADDFTEIRALALIDSLLENFTRYAAENPDIEDDIIDIICEVLDDFDIEYTIEEV